MARVFRWARLTYEARRSDAIRRRMDEAHATHYSWPRQVSSRWSLPSCTELRPAHWGGRFPVRTHGRMVNNGSGKCFHRSQVTPDRRQRFARSAADVRGATRWTIGSFLTRYRSPHHGLLMVGNLPAPKRPARVQHHKRGRRACPSTLATVRRGTLFGAAMDVHNRGQEHDVFVDKCCLWALIPNGYRFVKSEVALPGRSLGSSASLRSCSSTSARNSTTHRTSLQAP